MLWFMHSKLHKVYNSMSFKQTDSWNHHNHYEELLHHFCSLSYLWLPGFHLYSQACILFLYECDHIVWTHLVWLFFCSAQHLGNMPRLLHVSIIHSFLLQRTIPSYGYTPSSWWSIHLMMGFWVVSNIGLLWAMFY